MIKVVETADAGADSWWLPEQGMASHYRRSTLADHVLSRSRHRRSLFRAVPVADVIFLRMNLRNSAWRHGRVRIET